MSNFGGGRGSAFWRASRYGVSYRAVEELDEEFDQLNRNLNRQGRENDRLRSEIAAVRGSTDQLLTLLTRTVAELSEVHQALTAFAGYALARHRVRHLIMSAVARADSATDGGASSNGGGSAGSGAVSMVDAEGIDDVPGYWLPPAGRAFAALVAGDSGGGPALGLALQRDESRTTLLLCAGAAVAGRLDLGAQWLARALPPMSPERAVSEAERVLWTAAARGSFGAAGQVLIEQRLATLVESLDPERRDALAATIEQRVAALASGRKARRAAYGSLPIPMDVKTPETAATRLSGLREVLSDEPPETARAEPGTDRSDGAVAGDASVGVASAGVAPAGVASVGVASVGVAPAGVASVGGDRADGCRAGRDTALERLLCELVDEGSDEEAPLLRRAAELRASLTAGCTPSGSPPGSPLGDVLADPIELLVEDALGASDGTADRRARRRLARGVLGRWILATAESLAAATRVDAPGEVAIELQQVRVRVRPNGPNAMDLAAMRSAIESLSPADDGRRSGLAVPLLVLGAVLCLSLFGWPAPLAVLATIGGLAMAVTGAVLWRRPPRGEEAVSWQASEVKAAERRAEKAAADLAAFGQLCATRAERAEIDLAAIRDLVAPAGRGGGDDPIGSDRGDWSSLRHLGLAFGD